MPGRMSDRIKSKTNVETGEDESWELKDLRKMCATYYDEHALESSIETSAIRSVESPIDTALSRSLGFQGNHDAFATDSVRNARQRL